MDETEKFLDEFERNIICEILRDSADELERINRVDFNERMPSVVSQVVEALGKLRDLRWKYPPDDFIKDRRAIEEHENQRRRCKRD